MEETLLLEKVKASKIVELNKHYRLEFTSLNNFIYTLFITKSDVKEKNLDLEDYFDLIKIDKYRNPSGTIYNDSIFDTEKAFKYSGVYSYLTIIPNHMDPAVFNRI